MPKSDRDIRKEIKKIDKELDMKVWGIYSNKLEQYVHTGRMTKKKQAIAQLNTMKVSAEIRGHDISDYEIKAYELPLR